MTQNTKRALKTIGKGAFWTLLTAGGYFLAKGALHVILDRLEPEEQKGQKGEGVGGDGSGSASVTASQMQNHSDDHGGRHTQG
ncbi:MAG: hypothetical protein DMG26_15630 [Acidobacteria bacterium]|nr:MAG: hypothetical protein DMG25_05520 [Acidobacteriota bacterium]PYV00174.1 MAG: hypothetical protein DMG26_15630 [Acidobacteriota bacterium]PYV23505.1 MAG: hypothetical protein DMG27_15525 [Acidobacteriota bacterium]